MKYDNIFGHYYPHEKRGEIYDGSDMKREKVTLKDGREVVRLTAPLKLYDKKVTRATWLRNLQKHYERKRKENQVDNANANEARD
tara:strand:- start:1022 stop:1276 length:255 start_codon:yes stop_codon:yes gene_type:complete